MTTHVLSGKLSEKVVHHRIHVPRAAGCGLRASARRMKKCSQKKLKTLCSAPPAALLENVQPSASYRLFFFSQAMSGLSIRIIRTVPSENFLPGPSPEGLEHEQPARVRQRRSAQQHRQELGLGRRQRWPGYLHSQQERHRTDGGRG